MEQFYDNRWFKGKWLPFHQLHSLTGVSITWPELYPIYLTAMIWAPLWANTFASTVTTCRCNFVCQELHNSPCDEPCMVDHFSNSHLVLILHLLLGMSPRLMSLLIVCLVSRCHCSAFSTRCIAMPAPCPIPTFFSKV